MHLARRSAADAWLVKPFTPLDLKRAVRNVLNPPDDTAEVARAGLSAESVEEEAPVAG